MASERPSEALVRPHAVGALNQVSDSNVLSFIQVGLFSERLGEASVSPGGASVKPKRGLSKAR